MKLKFVMSLFLIGFICFSCSDKSTQLSDTGSVEKNVEGQRIYERYCIACHSKSGKPKAFGVKNINKSKLNMDERILLITNGRKTMTAYKTILTEAEIKAVAEYTFQIK